MILLIDNYDSFTYNVKQYIEELGGRCVVHRNDSIDVGGIKSLNPARIVISPGPGDPDFAGVTLDAIRAFAGKIPILGICLGHQAIGQAFGGRVIRAPKPKHGKVSSIRHHGLGMFAGIPSPMKVARYHSLIVERSSLPDCLEITAESSEGPGGEGGLIMALRHREYDVQGVQFHPESIATENGHALLRGFLGGER